MKRILIVAGLASFASFAHANLLMNGSFESGPTVGSAGYTTVVAGDPSISGWTVGGNSVDYIGNYWKAQHLSHSIDLGGNGTGSISTSFGTVQNQLYRVTFWMSGNPDYGSAHSTTYQLALSAGDLSADLHNFSSSTFSRQNMEWVEHTAYFTATSASTTLLFASINPPGAFGPALDNVSVEAVPEPFTMAFMGIAALAGYGKVRRRKSA